MIGSTAWFPFNWEILDPSLLTEMREKKLILFLTINQVDLIGYLFSIAIKPVSTFISRGAIKILLYLSINETLRNNDM